MDKKEGLSERGLVFLQTDDSSEGIGTISDLAKPWALEDDRPTYVKQEDGHGCLIACIAMITGKTYQEVAKLCRPSGRLRLHQAVANEVLGDLGYATVCRYKYNPITNLMRKEWPVPPFAPVHIAYVNVPSGYHAVVLLRNGTVLDPWDTERENLDHPDYLSIDHIDGIYRVG